MLERGDYKLIGVISSEGTGKSTYIKRKIIDSGAYNWHEQRCLIITESEPKAYQNIKRVHDYSQLERLERYRGKAPLRTLYLRGKSFRARLREIRKLKRFMAKYNLTEADLMKYYEITEKISTKTQSIP